MTPEAEQFVKLLIQEIRDPSVSTLRSMASGALSTNSVIGSRWNDLRSRCSEDDLVTAAVDAVDEAVFRLLDVIDRQELDLVWRREELPAVVLTDQSDGFQGDYLDPEGPRTRYSQQPFHEDV